MLCRTFLIFPAMASLLVGITPCFIDTVGYCLTFFVNIGKSRLNPPEVCCVFFLKKGQKKQRAKAVHRKKKIRMSYSKVRWGKDDKKMNIINKINNK